MLALCAAATDRQLQRHLCTVAPMLDAASLALTSIQRLEQCADAAPVDVPCFDAEL